ncbi:PDZ domain-containing protein [Neobacillus terrae]|uniref:PDZ domain-containing protein n=1 Tax=Neobacillus terrae TaxID=3034837 RepID=UPI00140E0ABF|nr:PDZ domain-containing protein [Neobacillus terrae]NHM29932.1 PDZ domain-containing protein [Neobacillus terrae]
MLQDWLVEIVKGTGRMFLHPVLYYLIVFAGILGAARVKRERKNFHVRAFDAYFELRQLFPLGVLIGLVLSVIVLAAGIAVPFAAILLIAVFTLLLNLTASLRLMAPAYAVGTAFFALIIISENKWNIPVFTKSFAEADKVIYPSVAIILALLLIAEGILIFKNGSYGTSPKLITSKRGQRVGVHEVKRLWILPIFMLIPGNVLHLPFDWWPVFSLGEHKFSLLLVPFAIGFNQQIQGMLPKEAVQTQGKRVIALGVLTLLISIAGYWYPVISIVAVSVAVIGRELLALIQRVKDENLPFYFSKKNHGLMILGIIPNSPAHKMALQVGELVTKVNGVNVRDEQSFYEALQKNRAHCKLEVIDTNGQIRFVQRALYEGDHYELGILFVLEERKLLEKVQ